MNSEIIEFIKETEKKITPDGIATTFNNAQKLMQLPKFVQNSIVKQNTKSNQYMGFVVEPYSLF